MIDTQGKWEEGYEWGNATSDPVEDIKKWAKYVKDNSSYPYPSSDDLKYLLDSFRKQMEKTVKEKEDEWVDTEDLIREAKQLLMKIVNNGAAIRDREVARQVIQLLDQILGD